MRNELNEKYSEDLKQLQEWCQCDGYSILFDSEKNEWKRKN